jgi:hypothetical protein
VFTSIDATTTGADIVVYNGGSNGGTANTWTFDNTGKLKVPGPVTSTTGNTLILKGGASGPAGQFATSNGASLGYGGTLAIFRPSDFTSGSLSSVQVGNVVVENNGATANVVTVTPDLAGPGTVGVYLDNYWNQVPPYTWYAGYGADQSVTLQSGTANLTLDSTGNLSFPSAGAFMKNVRVVSGGSVPSGFFPTYYNPTTGEFIVVTP